MTAKTLIRNISANTVAKPAKGRTVQPSEALGNKVAAQSAKSTKAADKAHDKAKAPIFDTAPIVAHAVQSAFLAENAKAEFEADALKLYAAGVKIGDRPKCAIATTFYDQYVTHAQAKGAKGIEKIKKNADKWLTAFRRTANTGAKLDLNISQTKAREAVKAAKVAAANAPATPIMGMDGKPINLQATPAGQTPTPDVTVKTIDGKTVTTERVKYTKDTAKVALMVLTRQIRDDLGEASKAWGELCTLYPSLRTMTV